MPQLWQKMHRLHVLDVVQEQVDAATIVNNREEPPRALFVWCFLAHIIPTCPDEDIIFIKGDIDGQGQGRWGGCGAATKNTGPDGGSVGKGPWT